MEKEVRSKKRARSMLRVFFVCAILLSPFFLLHAPPSFAYTSPGKPVGLVNDFAHVLTPSESQDIGTKLLALNKQTGVEFAVVMVPTIGTDETIESYAVKLFQEWGIGNKEKDTGLLLLVAVNDRQMRIETGYGIEGAVTDIQSGNIIRNVLIPAFKTGNYGAGISSAVDALTAIITKSPEAAQYSVQPQLSSNKKGDPSIWFAAIFIILNILARILGRTKSWWLGGLIGAIGGTVIGFIWGFIFTGLISVAILTFLGLAFDYFVSKNGARNWPSIWWLGGGRGGGFGGGGFGGFGGGSSGGGGASGRW